VIFSPNTPAGDQISIEDYAVALVDEIENPAHARQRFAVAN
jgi:putative NADH-flavin reductase